MWLPILLLLLGFVLLLKGADYFVEGASSLALRLSVSQIVVGLTVVAFGTSAPELLINVFAAYNDNVAISFGNVIGSNIINTLLILGVAGLIRPLGTQKNTVWREIPFALLAVLALLVLCNDALLNRSENMLSRGDGLILLLFFIIFLTYSFAISKVESRDQPDVRSLPVWKISLYIGLGLSGLIAGGHLTVQNAVQLAGKLGLSEKFIGLTIIAIGTSLPELVTSAVAARKGKADIAMGNIVGSNIFNILFILAVTSLIRPLPFQAVLNYDLLVLVVASLLLFITMFSGKRRILDRWEALVFILIYIAYTVYLTVRN